MESDPAVFHALARDLLQGVGSESMGVSLQEVLVNGVGGVLPAAAPRVEEALTLDADGLEPLCGSRAFLVCFNDASVAAGAHPVAAAAAEAGATAAAEHLTFVRQVPGLDAACGLIGLVHALANADGLLGARDSPLTDHHADGPLSRWLNGLPHDASGDLRGRVLIADHDIRNIYRAQATRGQSRMPTSESCAWLCGNGAMSKHQLACLGILAVLVWCAFAVTLAALKGVRAFLIFSGVSILWVLGWQFLPCKCFNPGPKLECHFVCLATCGGRIVLFDGCQTSPQDIGASGETDEDFVRASMAFIRERLLPVLAQPHTCSVLALKPAVQA